MTTVNDKLTEYSENNEHTGGSAMRHVLQRHHDILQDYTQEFRKTSANLKARKEREDLLHSVRKDIEYVFRITWYTLITNLSDLFFIVMFTVRTKHHLA